MTDTETLRLLSRLNAQFIENYVHNDVAAHDQLLHPAFSYLNGSGSRVDRVSYLAAWAYGFDPAQITYWDLRDEEIVLHNGVAFVSAANRYVENGADGMAAYTDTYVLETGAWTCIRAQITAVAKSHWPSDDSVLRVYLRGVLQPGSCYGAP